MEVMMVRQGDEDRLDALERAFVALRSELMAEMDRRFDRVDDRFERIEGRLDKIDERFERLDERFERIDDKFERMHQLLIKFGASMIGTLILTCGGLVASNF